MARAGVGFARMWWAGQAWLGIAQQLETDFNTSGQIQSDHGVGSLNLENSKEMEDFRREMSEHLNI